MFLGRLEWRAQILAALGLAAAGACPGAEEMAGWWHFNGCDGKVARDASGHGNDGVITDGVLCRERGVTSLEFDGMDAAVVVTERSPLALSNTLTAAAWIRPDALRHGTVLFSKPHPNPQWTTPVVGMYAEEGRAVFGVWNNRGRKALLDSPELPLRAWTFLAGTYDGAAVRLYVNGALASVTNFTGALAFNKLPLFLGRAPSPQRPSFRGRIGELRLYARALDAGEVRALHDATKKGYDISIPPPPAKRHGDGTVIVESCGGRPTGQWRGYETRILEGLKGYSPQRDTVALDRYGGWAGRKFPATGFFRPERLGERWWLIDPEGHRFLSIGLNTVAPAKLLDAALVRKFGSRERWAEATTRALRENGFNSKGSGGVSDNKLMRAVETPLPYTWLMGFMSSFGREKKLTYPTSGHAGYSNECIPVFHPDFEAFCNRYAGIITNAGAQNDPYLLGIFSDNELLCPTDLLDRHLTLDAGNPNLKPGLDAATAWLAERKGRADTNLITRRDRFEFIGHVFDRYYQIVSQAIRRYDTNHMYIGSRVCFRDGQLDNPCFWKAMGKYVDVATVNYYGVWGPDPVQVSNWHAWSGRPVIISEWYTKAMDAPGLANTNGAGWVVHTQEDRGKFYQHYALGLLESKSCVGWHWFKYVDDPRESTALDCSGGANKGMFGVDYEPHAPLLERARALNGEAYPLTTFFDGRR